MLDVDGDFSGAAGYLNTGSIGIPPRVALDALRAGVEEWGRGDARAPAYDSAVSAARAAFGRLHGAAPEQVAVGPQVSYFAALVAAGLPAGAEVVGHEGDFTSVLFPFMARGDLRVRLVPLDEVAAAVGPETALVAVSAVQSADGRVADLASIARAAADRSALTLIDATQAAGWLPLRAADFDFVAAGGYKWLLSPRGSAFMTVRSPELLERVPPLAAGWYAGDDRWDALYGAPLRLAPDARRLDLSPAWLTWVGTAPALEYVERIGVEAIRAHDLRLANRVREALGLEPTASPIVAFEHDAGPAELEAAGVVAAARNGLIRVGFHLYNTDDDVDRLLAALGRA